MQLFACLQALVGRKKEMTLDDAIREFLRKPSAYVHVDEGFDASPICPGCWWHGDITIAVGGHQLGYVQRFFYRQHDNSAEVTHFRTEAYTTRKGVGTAMAHALRAALARRHPGLVSVWFVSPQEHVAFFQKLGAVHRGRFLNGGGQPYMEW
jgi:hypothetical protein